MFAKQKLFQKQVVAQPSAFEPTAKEALYLYPKPGETHAHVVWFVAEDRVLEVSDLAPAPLGKPETEVEKQPGPTSKHRINQKTPAPENRRNVEPDTESEPELPAPKRRAIVVEDAEQQANKRLNEKTKPQAANREKRGEMASVLAVCLKHLYALEEENL